MADDVTAGGGRGSPARRLSPAQEGLRTIFQVLGPDAPRLLNSFGVLELRGGLDVRRLEAAAGAVVARHEMLRAAYDLAGDAYRIGPPWTVAVALVPDAVADDVAGHDLLRDRAARPFAPDEGRPVRLDLLRRSPDRYLLGLTVDHMCCDQISLSIIAEDLLAAYESTLASQPAVPVGGYDEYAAEHRSRRDDPVRHAPGLAHWRDHLTGVRPTPRPFGLGREAVWSARGTSVGFEVDGAGRAALAEVAATARVPIFAAALAATAEALAAASDADEVTFVTLPSSRPRARLRRVVGLFANVALLRVTGARSDDRRTCAQRAGEAVLGALDHPEVVLGDLVGVPGVLGLLNQAQSFLPIVHYLDESRSRAARPAASPAGGAVEWAPYVPPVRDQEEMVMLPVDLHLVLRDLGDRILGEARCNAAVFDPAAGRRLVAALTSALTASPDEVAAT